jgi:hypothetical protein
MKRLWVMSLAYLLLAACQRTTPAPTQPVVETPPVAATETSPPAPTATPVPADTATPEPPTVTPTPTETPTPTPNPTVTPDPNQGVGDVVYEDRLDGSSGWNWGFSDDVVAFAISGGRLNATLAQASPAWRYSVRPDRRAGDQQVRVTAFANACAENDEYGLMFRGDLDDENNFSGYVFKLNCAGAARVEALDQNQVRVLVNWTAAPAIVRGVPAENTLLVWAGRDQFHFYVNDEHLFSAQDPTYAEGIFGFYVRGVASGDASFGFDDLLARAVTPP